jgi:hypothetical protein
MSLGDQCQALHEDRPRCPTICARRDARITLSDSERQIAHTFIAWEKESGLEIPVNTIMYSHQ